MLTSISVRDVLREARLHVARGRQEPRLRRGTQLAAFRAIEAVREAYALEGQLIERLMRERAQRDWRERREMVEAELTHIEITPALNCNSTPSRQDRHR